MELYELILLAKKHEQKALCILMEKFKNLLKKYARKLMYEDAENELHLFFIELIYDFPIEKFGEKDEGKIVVYINRCIYHEYIFLLKKLIDEKKEIAFCNISEEQQHIIESKFAIYDDDSSILMMEIKSSLSEKEWELIKKIYILDYSVSEVAENWGISRQAGNSASTEYVVR